MSDDDVTLPPLPVEERIPDDDVTLPPTPVERIGRPPPPQPPPPPRRTGRLLALVGAAVLVAVVALDAVSTPASSEPAAPRSQEPATSGVWYCPVTAQEGSAILSIAATGDLESSIEVARHTPEGPITTSDNDPAPVQPGEQRDIVLDGTLASQPVSVRWSGGASVVTWRAEGADETAALPCSPGPSPTWYLSGLDTANGSATLHLFNPFTTDAVARVTFATPEGPTSLVGTESLLVEAGTSRRFELLQFVPEKADLGVVVEVVNGRLVAAGEALYQPANGVPGPAGRTLVPAADDPAESWAFAYAETGGESDSWLSVVNPGDSDAAVQVQVSDANPGSDIGPPTEHTVPAGSTLRIPLDEASTAGEFGVAVNVVNEQPVVVTRTSVLVRDGRRGVVASLGAEPSAMWALAGGGEINRATQLSVYNPGTNPVNIEVDAGDGTPEGWAAVQVEPNARTVFEMTEVADRDAIPVRVRADAAFVAELRVLADADGLRPWTGVAVPEVRWSGPATRPTVRRDPSLDTTPLGQPSAEATP